MACKYFHAVSTVTVNDGVSVVLDFSIPAVAVNENKFCFKIVTDIPATAANLPVLLTINGVATNALWNKYGNPAIGADLTRGKLYHGYYGSTVPHVITKDIPSPICCNCGAV